MNKFKWEEDYSVDIKEIDEHHKKFIGIIEKLSEGLNANLNEKVLEEILEELIEYGGFHFYTEEYYFDKFNYEFADEHKKAHSAFNEKIKEFQEKAKSDKMEVSFELIDYLENWLVGHIMNVDKKYTECFHEHGLY
jgi:hemerythrin